MWSSPTLTLMCTRWLHLHGYTSLGTFNVILASKTRKKTCLARFVAETRRVVIGVDSLYALKRRESARSRRVAALDAATPFQTLPLILIEIQMCDVIHNNY